MIFLYRPRLHILRQYLALKALGDAVFLRIALVIPAARLANIQYLARLAELLISHLQRFYDGIRLALFRIVLAPYREQDISAVSLLGTARTGIAVARRNRLLTVLVMESRVGRH